MSEAMLYWLRIMVFNVTFNNISVLSWHSVLLMVETGVLQENHRAATSHWQTLSHIKFISPWVEFKLTTLVVIGTDCIGSCTSNYHTIMTTTAPYLKLSTEMSDNLFYQIPSYNIAWCKISNWFQLQIRFYYDFCHQKNPAII